MSAEATPPDGSELAGGSPVDPDIEDAAPGGAAGPTLPHALAVLVGGFIGTLARQLATSAVDLAPEQFPWIIVVINLSGAAALGLLGGLVFARRPERVSLRLFLATGVLGGWTTYSAIVAGLLTEVRDHAVLVAGLNLVVSLVAPTLAALCGMVAAVRLLRLLEARR